MITPAIGSVLPLPELGPITGESLLAQWTAGHTFAAYWTARAALCALLKARRARRIWLPAYACSALAQAASSAGVEICWYGVDDCLSADEARLAEGLRSGDVALVIAYFGQSPASGLLALAASRPDVLWIEDRAQALAVDGPTWAEVALYSPRKLVGAPDGGLLVGRGALPTPESSASPVNAAPQLARLADPKGLAPETWYPGFQAQEAAFDATPLAMSELTREVLEGINPAPLVLRRRENFAALAEALKDYGLWPDLEIAFAPMVFPVRIADRDEVVRRMAAERIYCAHHWPDLPSPAEDFPGVHALNAELLSIPCDHRYGAEDMARVAEKLTALARPAQAARAGSR